MLVMMVSYVMMVMMVSFTGPDVPGERECLVTIASILWFNGSSLARDVTS